MSLNYVRAELCLKCCEDIMRDLTLRESKFLIDLMQLVSYPTCSIRHKGSGKGNPLSDEEISSELGMRYDSARRCLASLRDKNILNKVKEKDLTTGKNRKVTYINKDLVLRGKLIEVNENEEDILNLGENGLYIIKNNENNLIKIGITQNISQRIRGLKTTFNHCGIPCDLELLYYVQDVDNVKLEKHLHKYFKDNNSMNEWFEINPNIVIEYIDSIKEHYLL